MKDLHKGVILLLLACLVSIITFFIEDRHWEMAFIRFNQPDPNQDVADIQAQLLAGIDPTLIAEPTAAGPTNQVKHAPCFNGKISRDSQADSFHDQPYISIKENQATYIIIANDQAFLRKSPYEMQSASIIPIMPATALSLMHSAVQAGRCASLDLHLAKIKQ